MILSVKHVAIEKINKMTQPDSKHSANVFVDYLHDRIIAIADRKSEREIAEEIGYHNPETIRRIKDGELRLPLDLVGAIAKAIEVDAAYLARLWIASHVPDGADLVEPMMTPNESEISRDHPEHLRSTAIPKSPRKHGICSRRSSGTPSLGAEEPGAPSPPLLLRR